MLASRCRPFLNALCAYIIFYADFTNWSRRDWLQLRRADQVSFLVGLDIDLTVPCRSGHRVMWEAGLRSAPVFPTNSNCSTGSSALFLARELVLGGRCCVSPLAPSDPRSSFGGA